MSDFPDYKTVSIDSLIPYARNSRSHSDEQVAQIAASIREFGFLNPVIVDGDNGIIAGHGRVLAAQKLGMDSLPCIEASHLTDDQVRAYVIADNRIAEHASWDFDILKMELSDLSELHLAEITGFSEAFWSQGDKDEDFFGDDEDFFGEDESGLDENDVKADAKKTDEGYAEFSVVMRVENRDRLLRIIRDIKKKHSLDKNEDAMIVIMESLSHD